jgi:hypothetical protein
MGRLTVLEALAVPFRTCYRARGGARLRAAFSANGFRALDRTPAARAPVHAPVRADPNGHTAEGPTRSGRGRGRSSARRRCAAPSCPGSREDEDPGTRKTARPAHPLPPRRRGPCALGDESGSLWHLRREIAKTATPIRGGTRSTETGSQGSDSSAGTEGTNCPGNGDDKRESRSAIRRSLTHC